MGERFGRHRLGELIAAGDEVIAACTSADMRKPADLVVLREVPLHCQFVSINHRRAGYELLPILQLPLSTHCRHSAFKELLPFLSYCSLQ